MNGINQGDNVIDRSLGQNSVAEIEDMTGASAGAVEDRARALANFGDSGEQRNRVEIALNRNVLTEPLPRFREIDAPVETDNVAARLAHEFEQIAGDRTEMDHRNRAAARPR